MPGKSLYLLLKFNKYRNKIYNYFWYRVNFNDALSEDLTSEVFLRVVDKFDTFDREKPFQPWVYAIAKNILLNHYRSRGREVELVDSVEFAKNYLDNVEQKIDCEKIIEKIEKLDDYSREVLMLRYVDQLSNKEIAELMNKKEVAIRVQLTRALKKLKAMES